MSIQNVTKFHIERSANDVYEAFADPAKICNFWFSKSSCRWETGTTVTLEYIEYGAGGFDIKIIDAQPGKRIEFLWGDENEENTVAFDFTAKDSSYTIIQITETGWRADDPDLTEKVVGNKEGWVYMLCCLKAYLENNVTSLRTGLIHESTESRE